MQHLLQFLAQQAPLSVGFLRQEYWSGLPFPSPGALPDSVHAAPAPFHAALGLALLMRGLVDERCKSSYLDRGLIAVALGSFKEDPYPS